jgi:hypothetical protein
MLKNFLSVSSLVFKSRSLLDVLQDDMKDITDNLYI